MHRLKMTLTGSIFFLCFSIHAAAESTVRYDWPVGTWECIQTDNDLPVMPEAAAIADAGFTNRFDVTLSADGTFAASGQRTNWTGPVSFTASGGWRGNDSHWLAMGESKAFRGTAMPAVVNGETGEIVEPAQEPESWTAPFETGGQRVMDRVVNARPGVSGASGIESFTVCRRRPD